jgi:hypothetical protein
MTKYSKLPSKMQIGLFIIYTAILVILLLNLFGVISFYSHSNPKPVSNTVYYTLDWQNQPGTPFTITDLSTYQFLDIHLILFSDSNFTQNNNITLSAYGTMSESLINSSLAYIRLSYNGAIPYPPEMGYSGGPYFDLTVVPNGTSFIPGLAFGDTVHVTGKATSITWAFAGGPHYPTLSIQYWSGSNITQEFSSAPIMVQASQTPQPTQDTLEQIALNWAIGGTFIAITEVIYLRFPRKTIHVPLK